MLVPITDAGATARRSERRDRARWSGRASKARSGEIDGRGWRADWARWRAVWSARRDRARWRGAGAPRAHLMPIIDAATVISRAEREASCAALSFAS